MTRILPPPTPLQRWLVLLFVSIAMFGNYYVYDSLGPVVDLMRSDLGFSYRQIGWLSTAYNVAALLMLLIGGVIIDRFGTKVAITVFALVCLAAAALTAATPNYETILAGRFLLGIGAEPLIVAATTVLAKWFRGRELSFAFGLNLSISRLGSASADWSTQLEGVYTNWQDPLWLATGVAAIGVTGAMLYWFLEQRSQGRVDLGPAAVTDKLEWRELYRFSASYWYIVALCVVFYSTVFPFRSFAIDYFQQAHGLTRETAGMLSSLLPFAAIFATPLFGLLVDRVGKRSLFMAVGSLAMLPLYLAVTYLPAGPGVVLPFTGGSEVPLTLLVVIVTLGLVFSLIPAVLWPSVAHLVDEERLGSAYALMTFCQQIGMAAVPVVIGLLNDWAGASPENPAGYAPGMWFYTVLGAFGLWFSWRLWRSGQGANPQHTLDRPPARIRTR